MPHKIKNIKLRDYFKNNLFWLDPNKNFVYILRHTDRITAKRVLINFPDSPDAIGIEKVWNRRLIIKEFLPIVGTCTVDGQGSYGIELTYNRWLSSSKDIKLAAKLQYQRFLHHQLLTMYKKFNVKSIVGIVMESDTGNIIALTFLPQQKPLLKNPAITDNYALGNLSRVIIGMLAFRNKIIPRERLLNILKQ